MLLRRVIAIRISSFAIAVSHGSSSAIVTARIANPYFYSSYSAYSPDGVHAGSSPLTVTLESTDARVILPASVTIPAGESSVKFTARTLATTTPVAVTIRARQGSLVRTTILTIRP
ncbi:MAG: hypothetical protein SFX74_08265 [Fimbriimonadaceae bacterium]|nr:hypothetical protein [Fimbriimonadaceae bacterium]